MAVDQTRLFISIHAPRVGSDSRRPGIGLLGCISIHAPRVGSDGTKPGSVIRNGDFNPRSPCGERPAVPYIRITPGVFQSTLPVWGATERPDSKASRFFISIHAPRVGSDQIGSAVGRWRNISIHAPRVGSDGTGSGRGFRVLISIHAPRVGSDFGCAWVKGVAAYFNPRSPCGERPPRHRDDLPQQDFNPRSPCGERQHSFRPQVLTLGFQSTLPVWGATDFYNPMFANLGISIHAPRVGSDRISQRIQAGRGISIHAPRVGSDILAAQKRQEDWNFNPRSPCGERLSTPVNTPGTIRFQSTLPVWGATPPM